MINKKTTCYYDNSINHNIASSIYVKLLDL